MHGSSVLLSAMLSGLLLTACGADEPVTAEDEAASTPASITPAESPEASNSPPRTIKPEPKGVLVDITISGDQVRPNGERIEVEPGEPIVLSLDSDRSGELHVHSTPEQEIAFEQGSSQHELVIEQPGVAEIEDHESGFVIVQLQVG